MFSAFERLVAGRYLRSRRQEGFISVIAWFSLVGIMLGVATLIIVMSVMNGFREELFARILGLGGHMSVMSVERSFTDYDLVANKVRAVEGVVSVTPLVEGQVMATANGVASGALVRGVRAVDFAARPILANAIVEGDLKDYAAGKGVMVGSRLAARMGLRVGGKITLISPKGNVSSFGTVPRMKAYPVAAVFQIGMFEYDNSYIYMPLSHAQVFFKKKKSISVLEILTEDADAITVMRKRLFDALGADVHVLDWQQVNSSFFTALQVERNVMFLILTLIIIVAAFNIISSQIMLVNDKGRGIAILRTMGATRGMILRIFFMTGASVGVIGTALGGVLGISFALNIESIRQWVESLTKTDLFAAEIYFLSKLPAVINPGEVITVVLMALVLSFLASIIPARRAARLDPVEVLRYE
ncbi:MAG: lipoprotein-releasing ABC transporter permease subunit [Rhodospirillaceae bacterium]|jgi:lipoprotein-releasing system permease protein|nr:lipoprotein-releasing ABC transporter permease subunit [Rhodospirillaceae bacterium]MBT5666070.1 lipoprotein-releasing ABC transporter permease subunit [Rhodospirillaceae bacterium]